jgi:hypothetical protein
MPGEYRYGQAGWWLWKPYDEEHPEWHGHRKADVAGQHGTGVIPDEDHPPLVGDLVPSPAGPAGQVPADGARRDTEAELQERIRGDSVAAQVLQTLGYDEGSGQATVK